MSQRTIARKTATKLTTGAGTYNIISAQVNVPSGSVAYLRCKWSEQSSGATGMTTAIANNVTGIVATADIVPASDSSEITSFTFGYSGGNVFPKFIQSVDGDLSVQLDFTAYIH